MAKLPKKLVRKPRPTLESIKIGETVFIQSTNMAVTGKRDCFLEPTAIYKDAGSILYNLRVKRGEDGFHVAVVTKDDWPTDASRHFVKDWIPVASIVVDLDSDLDIDKKLKSLLKRAKGKRL